MQCIAPRFLNLNLSLDLPLTFFVLVPCWQMQMAERYLMRCLPPTIVWRPGSGCACHASLGALGKRWGSGRLVHYANVNSGKARPSSIIGSDTPILIKKLGDNHSDSGVGAAGGDSWAWLHQLVSASVQPTHSH